MKILATVYTCKTLVIAFNQIIIKKLAAILKFFATTKMFSSKEFLNLELHKNIRAAEKITKKKIHSPKTLFLFLL